jgi:hypothetical protein
MDFAAGVYLSEGPNPVPYPPLTHFIRVNSILNHTDKGRGGEELNQIEEERGNSSQSWAENTNMTDPSL